VILEGDELEFAISQYLDGQLSADLAGALEERLAVDPAARELLRKYRQIRDTLAQPFSDAIDWEKSLREIRQTVDARATFASTNSTDSNADLTGLHRRSQSFWRQGRRRFAVPIALAASLLVAFTSVAVFVKHSKPSSPAIANVVGPHVEAPSGPVVAEVSIGPAPSVASSERLSHEEVGDRPSIVLIDRADNPPPDSDSIY
jgi:anti-sigma factor RsiW